MCIRDRTEARRREHLAAQRSESTALAERNDLPVFVMACMLPGETIGLNIFEPRYRLMFRRCLEGNSRLALTCALRVRSLPARIGCSATAAAHMRDQIPSLSDRALRVCSLPPRMCYPTTAIVWHITLEQCPEI